MIHFLSHTEGKQSSQSKQLKHFYIFPLDDEKVLLVYDNGLVEAIR